MNTIFKFKRRDAKKKLTEVPISKLIPSMITILALCMGITSIRYAMDYKWQMAASLIFIAGFLDGLDGRIARLLNATSGFGAQLDSLADLVSFAVAPAVVMYLWGLHYIPYKGVGWSIVLFFVACSAIRLARFNSTLSNPEEKKRLNHFFTGMPMPAAAACCLLPMISSFSIFEYYMISPWLVALYMCFISFMMISTIPTFSFKQIYIKQEFITLMLMAATLVFGLLLLAPWVVLPITIALYLLTIPVSIWQARRYTA